MANANAKDPFRREVFILSQLKPLTFWRGSLIHQCFELYFFNDSSLKNLNVEDLTEKSYELMNLQYQFSKNKKYRDESIKKTANKENYLALYEHEYNLLVNHSDLERIKEEIQLNINNFCENKEILEIILNGSRLYPERSSSLPFIENFSISATFDLIVMNRNKNYILDWKTTESDRVTYKRQLHIYAYIFYHVFQVKEPTGIEVVEYNLAQNTIEREIITREILDNAEDFIFESIYEIENLTGCKNYNQCTFNFFNTATKPIICKYCKYKKLCQNEDFINALS